MASRSVGCRYEPASVKRLALVVAVGEGVGVAEGVPPAERAVE